MAKMGSIGLTSWADQTIFTLQSGASVVGDDLEISIASAYPVAYTTQSYDLAGSFFDIEVLSQGTGGSGVETQLGVRLNPTAGWSNDIGFIISNVSMSAYMYASGTYSDNNAWIGFNPVAHKYLRVREDTGMIFWEYSSDRTSWTQFWSQPSPFPVTAVHGFLTAGMWQTVPSPTAARFGDVNGGTQPSNSTEQTVDPWTTVTLTGTGEATWTQISGTSVVLNGSGSTRTFIAPPSMSTQALTFQYGTETTTVNITRARNGIKQLNGTVKPFRLFVKPSDASGTTQVLNYARSTDSIPNPERGWYKYTQTHWTTASGAGQDPLSRSELETARTGAYIQPEVNKTISHTSLVYRYYVMEYMRNVDTIPPAFLSFIQNDMNTIRAAGLKVIPRFVYDVDDNTNMTPPYNADTTPSRTYRHIDQLAGVINDNADVVYALQAGFIGLWGEWFYSDNWGDQDSVSNAQWDQRYTLLTKLLTSIDSTIPILVRYPGIKRRYINSGSGVGWVAPSDAQNRIGFHNDAFVGDEGSDMGTYDNYTDGLTVEQMKDYVETETARPVPMVGENNFITTRSAYTNYTSEASRFHYTSLNPEYAVETISAFTQEQFDTIAKSLGYRLRLTTATLPSKASPGSNAEITLTIVNDGYSAPTTAYPMKLVFVGPETVASDLSINTRALGPGTHTVVRRIGTPTTLGDYTMYLSIPDPHPTLSGRPEYAVRLANTIAWTDGLNDLGAKVSITDSTILMKSDPLDPGTFVSTFSPDTTDPGTFEPTELTLDLLDPGTFKL